VPYRPLSDELDPASQWWKYMQEIFPELFRHRNIEACLDPRHYQSLQQCHNQQIKTQNNTFVKPKPKVPMGGEVLRGLHSKAQQCVTFSEYIKIWFASFFKCQSRPRKDEWRWFYFTSLTSRPHVIIICPNRTDRLTKKTHSSVQGQLSLSSFRGR